jgi:hypothetical protein
MRQPCALLLPDGTNWSADRLASGAAAFLLKLSY